MAMLLVLVGVAPSVAQRPRQEGYDHTAPQRHGWDMTMDHEARAIMATTGEMMTTQVTASTADEIVGPRRARRASGPSRLQAADRRVPATPAVGEHVERAGVRRFTGSSRVRPVVTGVHVLDADDAQASESSRRAIRRPSGPTRIPRR